jgi:hypothetical protein
MKEHEDEIPQSGAASAAPLAAEGREAQLQHLRCMLEETERRGSRTALILVEIDPNYASRALARWPQVIAGMHGGAEQARFTALGDNRLALVIAPIGHAGHARKLADRLTRALDPRVCPLLRRALPFAWAGVAVSPDDGAQPAALLAVAERALQQARQPVPRPQRFAFARRRPPTACAAAPGVHA